MGYCRNIANRGYIPQLPEGAAVEVPCLVDAHTTVWDSLAITEYVGERHPGVWPAEALARAWARSAAAEMHSGFVGLRNTCTMNCGIRVALNQTETTRGLLFYLVLDGCMHGPDTSPGMSRVH